MSQSAGKIISVLMGVLILGVVALVVNWHWHRVVDWHWRLVYAKIEVGMPIEEVNALLGPPTEPVFTSLEGACRPHTGNWVLDDRWRAKVNAQWKSGGRTISVRFNYGKVSAKNQKGVE
jgi:hypothetical protein